MKCKKCNKIIKENTGDNLKYCQGHSIFELSCDNCRKCGETICGNDTENLRCFEPN